MNAVPGAIAESFPFWNRNKSTSGVKKRRNGNFGGDLGFFPLATLITVARNRDVLSGHRFHVFQGDCDVSAATQALGLFRTADHANDRSLLSDQDIAIYCNVGQHFHWNVVPGACGFRWRLVA